MQKKKDTKMRKEHLSWFSGLVEGDGCFTFGINKREARVWNCTFKIYAHQNNIRMLEYCRTLIGLGSINKSVGIKNDTRQSFAFAKMCIALSILQETSSSLARKNLLCLLLAEKVPENYIASAWYHSVPSKAWIFGFVDAEGSFFITNKAGPQEVPRFVHSFSITQKMDAHVLQYIRKKLHISDRVQKQMPSTGGVYYKLESSNFRCMTFIGSFFYKQLKGRKSLICSIWKRTLKYRGNNIKLEKIQSLLRRLHI